MAKKQDTNASRIAYLERYIKELALEIKGSTKKVADELRAEISRCKAEIKKLKKGQ